MSTCSMMLAGLFLAAVASGPPAPSPTLGLAPPAGDGTIVLFDGSSWASWRGRDGGPSPWEVQDDGSVQVAGGDAITAREFGDCHLHVEFLCPEMPGRTGQGRANSGVYLHGLYEVQVLGSFGDEPALDNAGAIYGIAPPIVNAAAPAGSWQTYDIVLRAPRFDASGTMSEPARLTVLHNGIVVQNNVPVPRPTRGGLDRPMGERGPILLQDHGDPVRYRNIWVREHGR